MFKKIDTKGRSFDDISREVYGTPDKASDIARLNNNSTGDIIVTTDDKTLKSAEMVVLKAGEKNFSQFPSYVLLENLETVKAIILEFDYEPETQQWNWGQNVRIEYGGKVFLEGVLKIPARGLNSEGRRIRLEIKSYTGILVDSVVPPPLEFFNMSPRQTISQVCTIFGLSVEFQDVPEIDFIVANEIGVSFAADPFENCWNFIKRVAESVGLNVFDTGTGLFVGNLVEKEPVMSFIEGECVGVTNWQPDFNTENLGRYYISDTQFGQTSQAMVQIPFDLPITKRAPKVDSNNTLNYVTSYACKQIGKAFPLGLVLDDDVNLTLGDCAIVKSSAAFLNSETKMMAEGREIYNDGTILKLCLPCKYTGIIPERLPQ